MKLLNSLGVDVGTLAILLLVAVLLLAGALAIQTIRLNNWVKRYKKFMAKEAGSSFERRMLDRISKIGELETVVDQMQAEMQTVEKAVRASYQKFSIVKYDAFDEARGNVSFVLCLLDHNNSGILLNSMYVNDGSYSYIKELKFGNCDLELTDEEAEALKEAIAKGNILREKDLFA